ncbi:MAG: HEAT repeat domain-containing protein [Candidatus Methanoperedens sp.]|nr:HEAT repeat domain-containing protein [Candidatus Methanoperedens sp.]
MVEQSEIHRKSRSKKVEERKEAAEQLGDYFPIQKNKKQAIEDLLQLTEDKNDYVRRGAAYALGDVYSHIPDKHKQQAWENLLQLTEDKNDDVRRGAAYALAAAYSHIPDEHKQQAWEDLIKLTLDKNDDVRWLAVYTLGATYSHIPDEHKQQAWEDLIKLIQDKNDYLRRRAIYALGAAYSHIPDKHKQQAWEDLIKLMQDKNDDVRMGTADALDAVYSSIPDKHKQQAWGDLIKLTQDINYYVRRRTTSALGTAYSSIPDKYKHQAWDDMIRLTSDNDSDVRASAYHSLGKASIFRATNAKNHNNFKKLIEEAIGYFEQSTLQEAWSEPAKFCLPFYRSFYTLTFKKEEAEAEVQRYIAEAKSAVEGSRSKGHLLEAVENLGNALKEAQKARDFDALKSDLNAYRRYCERAADLLTEVEGTAPGAAGALRRALPIIDERIQGIIGEIREKAKNLCKKTKDTPLEPLGIETNEIAKQLSELKDISIEFGMDRLMSSVYKFCEYIPSDKRPEVCGKIAFAKNKGAPETGKIIADVFEHILNNIDIPRIKDVYISEKRNNTVRIATVQLKFKLTDSFPPKIINEEKVKNNVLQALKIAKEEKANIVCLPELCICEEWLPDIKRQCEGMIVIPGSYYDKDYHNICKLILNSDIEVSPQVKFNPSAFEDSEIMGSRMVPGDKSVNIYETEYGKLAVLICRDFGNFIYYLRGYVDMVFVPSYNDANERFHKDADTYVTNNPSYVIISNAAHFGGTSIFGQLNRAYFKILEQNGCKVKGDKSYKLCEIKAKKEGIIIADFNLNYKSPQLQTAIDPNEEIKPIKNIKKIEI